MKKQSHPNADKKSPTSDAPHPIVLLLPSAGKYHTGDIEALIFLAIESNSSLKTETAIACEIEKITNGMCSFSQNYISRRLRIIKERHIIARDKIWSIDKFEGKYKLLDLDEEQKINRDSAFSAIPFNRTTVFCNNPIWPTVFGFKLKTSPNNLAAAFKQAEEFFEDFLHHCIFQKIRQGDTLYILLDYTQYYYPTVRDRLKTFIENQYLLKPNR